MHADRESLSAGGGPEPWPPINGSEQFCVMLNGEANARAAPSLRVATSKKEAAMSQKVVGMSFVSVALLALVSLPVMAQTPFAPPPQIPYGLSVSIEGAKNAAAASVSEAQKNNWTMAIAIVDTGAISCI